MIISRTDGYALPFTWSVGVVVSQSCVPELRAFAAQSQAFVYFALVQSLPTPPYCGRRSKMQENSRSPLFVVHSRPLMGSQLLAEVGGQAEAFAYTPCVVRGFQSSIMWKSAPLKS